MTDVLDGYEWLSSLWGETITRFTSKFVEEPDLLVIHSASTANWVAEYLSNPTCDKDHIPTGSDPYKATDGCRLIDGIWYRVAAAHFSWYAGNIRKLRPGKWPKHVDRFVQQASLRRGVPGAGGSVCQGRGGVNYRSLHVELPAAPREPELVRGLFVELVADLREAVPGLKFWTTHQIIDPKRRRDPVLGSGFTPRWLDGSGLELARREG
jgi:hypothetical protein